MRDDRIYKVKNPLIKFYCPSCSKERGLRYSPNLSQKHYIQITITTIIISLALSPFIGIKGLISFFIIWPIFDLINRSNFRKDLTCPYCGFDAVWHKLAPELAKRAVDTKKESNQNK